MIVTNQSWEGSFDMTEWWRGAVIYQIYPRSFQDDSGDGIGDLKGIIRRLPYVASLNVDAIWLSPIFTSPMADMGYDVSDYRGIDPLFGTLQDFEDLIATAHKLGLKVIVDQVISHSSDKHPWFVESRKDRTSPKADWYVWADCKPDGTPPNNWASVFGGSAWEWDARRRQYYLHNFLTSQPDLNFHNLEVQQAHLDTLKFWLDRGVDGFRLDTVNYYFHDTLLRNNPPEPRKESLPAINPYDMQDHIYAKTRPENVPFLMRLRALLDQYKDRTVIGEVGEGRRAVEVMAEYTKGNDRLHMAYSFDMLGPQFTAEHFRSKIEKFFAGAPDGTPSWSFSNHDVQRHVTRWAEHGSAEAIAKLSIAMLSAFEGTIGIYNGEEFGQTETDIEFEELTDLGYIDFWPEHKGRDGCRTPMVWDNSANAGFSTVKPWLPVKALQAANNVAAQEARNDSVLHAYRAALAFRKSRAELGQGKTVFIDLPEPILAFHRVVDAKRLTCVFNLSPTSLHLTISGKVAVVGPQAATLNNDKLAIEANGYAYLESVGAIAPSLKLTKTL
jgi:alpha-glucosidase